MGVFIRQGPYVKHVGDIQGWCMHQGIDHGYHDLPRQAVSIEGVQKILQGMPVVHSINPFSEQLRDNNVQGSR